MYDYVRMRLGTKKILLLAMLFGALGSCAELVANPTYQKKCAGCHGPNAEGKAVLMIKTTPLNQAAAKSDAELTYIIGNGIPKTKMKGFGGKLSAEQIPNLVSEIKVLK